MDLRSFKRGSRTAAGSTRTSKRTYIRVAGTGCAKNSRHTVAAAVGFRCRRSKLRRFIGPPYCIGENEILRFRYFDLCQAASRTVRKIP